MEAVAGAPCHHSLCCAFLAPLPDAQSVPVTPHADKGINAHGTPVLNYSNTPGSSVPQTPLQGAGGSAAAGFSDARV